MKNYCELLSEYSSMVYEEFQRSAYGIQSCGDEDHYYDKDEYKLHIDLMNSGYKTACEIRSLENGSITLPDKNDDDIDINLYIIYKNTYITNNYTQTNSSSATGYVFTQASPSTVWTITNPLGYFPNVLVTTLAGQLMVGEVDIDPLNPANVIIRFNDAVSGKAFLS
jgi:hypothetical protein